MEVVMPSAPAAKSGPKKMKAFRVPPEMLAWLTARTDPKRDPPVTFTDAAVWALDQGRNLAEATENYSARMREACERGGLTEVGLLKKIVAAGLPAVERELGIRK